MFDRKSYMKEYYKKNQDKLKKYSSEYKKQSVGGRGRGAASNIPVEVKKGKFCLSFD